MFESNSRARATLDAALGWISFGYGIFATAVEPTLEHSDLQIAVGVEAVLLAVLGFLWARNRRSLGIALILAGVLTPVAMYGTAPLYWSADEVRLFEGEAFWTSVGVGTVAGVPLLALGIYTLVRARPAVQRPDPAWLTPLRWILQGGLLLIVIAFRAGDWDNGIPLVYAGAAIALLALLIALPLRIQIGRRGIGVLLFLLGSGAAGVIVVAGAFVGGNMSADEAGVGLLPAGLVALVGLVLMATGGGKRPAAAPGPASTGPSSAAPFTEVSEVSSGNLDDVIPEFLPPAAMS